MVFSMVYCYIPSDLPTTAWRLTSLVHQQTSLRMISVLYRFQLVGELVYMLTLTMPNFLGKKWNNPPYIFGTVHYHLLDVKVKSWCWLQYRVQYRAWSDYTVINHSALRFLWLNCSSSEIQIIFNSQQCTQNQNLFTTYTLSDSC